jgi:O-antigen/teichoic acid export membrane protein
MGIIKSQAIRSTAYIYMGVLLGFVIQGLLAPNVLHESQIGVINLINSYSGIFAALSLLGFGAVTVKYFPYFRDKGQKHHGFLLISFFVGALGFLLFLAIYYSIKPAILENNADKSPLFARYFFLIIPLTFFQLYYLLLDSYNNMLYNSTTGIILREFVQRLFILIALVFFTVHLFNFESYIYLHTAAICLPTVLLALHLWTRRELYLRPDFSFLNRKLVKGMAGIGLFGWLNGFSGFAILRVDSIMVNSFIDDAATGIYATTFYFGALVGMPARALVKIAPTMISDAYRNGDLETVEVIHKKSAINQFIIAVLIFIGLAINLDNVFEIIPRHFEPGRHVILFIALANVIKMTGGMDMPIIAYSNHFKMTTVFLAIFLVALVALNAVFIPMMGITGAAFASVIATLLFTLLKFIFIKRTFGFQPYTPAYLYILGFAFALYFLVSLIPPLPHFIADILLRSCIAVLAYGLFIYFGKFSGDANQTVDQLLHLVRRILK